MKKLTALRKKVDSKIKVVDTLMDQLVTSQEDAKLMLAQAQDELDAEELKYNTVKAGYEELKTRCQKVAAFVDKILGE